MDELPLCPFCGERPSRINDLVECLTESCPLFMALIPVDAWCTRPVEDRLQGQLDEAHRDKDNLSAELNQAVYVQDKIRAERDRAEEDNIRIRDALRLAVEQRDALKTMLST